MCYMSHWTTAHLLHSACLWHLLTAIVSHPNIFKRNFLSICHFFYLFILLKGKGYFYPFVSCLCPFFPPVLLNARLPYTMYATFIFGHHSLSSSVLALVLCSACRTKRIHFFKCLDSTQFGGHSCTETMTLVYRSISWTPVKSLLP